MTMMTFEQIQRQFDADQKRRWDETVERMKAIAEKFAERQELDEVMIQRDLDGETQH